MDQALLSAAVGPVLRVYAWRQPALSFGYFMAWEGAAAAGEERLLVRRWTGGGIVHHGADFTWSLIVPAPEPLRRVPPALSYCMIHRALVEALTAVGMQVQQVPVDSPAATGGLCFTTPAPGDLLMDGRKIAGAAQRRCRHGLLHQGSVCGVSLPADFPRLLAAALAETVTPFPAAGVPASAAAELEHNRYATEAWLRRR